MSSVDCFLCNPDEELVYRKTADGIALTGLGPVVSDYSVVATVGHVRSASDAAFGEAPDFAAFALAVRAALIESHGSCLMTEHGRVPLCDDISGTTDPHCFHAHFLLFPGAPDVEPDARGYFAGVEVAPSLSDALAVAQAHNEYFLLSPDPSRFLIMTRPGRLIRQFARMLVADKLGRSELANWRKYANRHQVIVNARSLRQRLNPR